MRTSYSCSAVLGAFVLGVWSGIAGLLFLVGLTQPNGAGAFWVALAMLLIGLFVVLVVMALSPSKTIIYVQTDKREERNRDQL